MSNDNETNKETNDNKSDMLETSNESNDNKSDMLETGSSQESGTETSIFPYHAEDTVQSDSSSLLTDEMQYIDIGEWAK
eukprot:11667267-Ditylum_brightwellii.AAC.1